MTQVRTWMKSLPAFAQAGEPASPFRNLAHTVVTVLLCLLALLIRVWVDPWLPPGLPYVTFFPVVIITGFVFGVRLGATSAALCGVAAWYFFIPPVFSLKLDAGATIALIFYAFIVSVDLLLIHLMLVAYRGERLAKIEQERLVDQQDVLSRELDHRLKNIFATIGAIIGLSQKHARTPQELADNLREKLDTMGRANLLLRGSAAAQGITLAALVEGSLAPFGAGDAGRLLASGPVVSVGAQAVVALSLIFHELGTNAAKYGALSNSAGRIHIRWITGARESEAILTIEWTESDGPAPVPSTHTGFGSTLIRRVIKGLGGDLQMIFPDTGACIRISMPLSALTPIQ